MWQRSRPDDDAAVGHPLADYLVGHAGLRSGPHGGVIPTRLPAWADRRHCRPPLHWAASTAAGIRIRVRTRARRVELGLHALTIDAAGRPARIVADGSVHEVSGAVEVPMATDGRAPYGVVVDGADTGAVNHVIIDRPADAGDLLEIQLSQSCRIELVSIDADAPITPAGPSGQPVWVHYGSSISHGADLDRPDRPWPIQVARSHGLDLRNLAFSGNALLDPFIGTVVGDLGPDLVTAELGINIVNSDAMRESVLVPSLHGFLDEVRERCPDVPIVLVTAIACPFQENTPGPIARVDDRFVPVHRDVEQDAGALTLARTRAVIGDVVADRVVDDPRLFVIDGLSLLGLDEAHLLYDGLHPDAAGVDLIAERFWPALQGLDDLGRPW